MKADPILYHGLTITGRMPTFKPCLRQANREGRKTETRRIIALPLKDPVYGGEIAGCEVNSVLRDTPRICPLGEAGDIRVMPEPLKELHGYAIYADDQEPVISLITCQPLRWRWKTKLLTSQFMPVEAGRFVVQYDDFRAERLHDITAASAIAEGIEPITGVNGKPGWLNYAFAAGAYTDPISSYRSLWDSINAKRGFPWAGNHWVWVIKYSPAKP